MVKKKTSHTQQKSLTSTEIAKIKQNPDLREFDPIAEITDENRVGRAIVECLRNNDPEGVMEVIQIYLKALEKIQFIKKADMPKSTFYHSLKSKNPTIKTLAKLVHATTIECQK